MVMDGNFLKKTLDYYEKNANDFIKCTLNADIVKIREVFLKEVREDGIILDLGCGSGRDSLAFRESGYQVVAVDGAVEICARAREIIGHPVICSTFEEYMPAEAFAGIWACASLLHLPFSGIAEALLKYSSYLENEGVFYLSFKYGNFSGFRKERYFTDLTESAFQKLLMGIPSLMLERYWFTPDGRPDYEENIWLNILCRKR